MRKSSVASAASDALDEVEQLKKKNDRLKKVFKSQIDKFRDATYLLTGYKISLEAGSSGKADRLYLRSMYAEREDVRCCRARAAVSVGAWRLTLPHMRMCVWVCVCVCCVCRTNCSCR